MKPAAKLYIKSFFLYTLTFAIAFALMLFLIGNLEHNYLLRISVPSIFFGVFMSWMSVSAQKKSILIYKNGPLTETDFSVCKRETIESDITLPTILERLQTNSLTSKWKVKLEGTTILGRVKGSRGSWGERIIIEKVSQETTITSHPILPTTLFDNGKNYANLSIIKSIVQSK
jgi:hypothetical protein